MSKRAGQFARRARDFYPTPRAGALPLLRHLPRGVPYWEPCAGDGALVAHLAGRATCVVATDLAPGAEGIHRLDAMRATARDVDATGAAMIITNPPWPAPGQGGEPVVGLARHLSALRPTWLLLPWDIAANGYFDGLAPVCPCIVPVGRVSWMGNGTAGKDNAAWFLFDARVRVAGPVVLSRTGGRTARAVHGRALRAWRAARAGRSYALEVAA